MCLFILQKSGEYSKTCSLAHYQTVVNIQRFSLSLHKSGEYSNVSASPLQKRDEYSKVVFVCLFVCLCLFVCVFVCLFVCLFVLQKSNEYTYVSANPLSKHGGYSKVLALLTKEW